MPRRRLILILFSAALVVFVFLLPGLVGYLTDWWWFREIGYQVVFIRTLVTQALLFLVLGGIAAGTLYLSLSWALRGLVPGPLVLRVGQAVPRANLTEALRRLTLPLSLGVGLLVGLVATQGWQMVLQAIYQTPFGIADPIFSRDIGFYIFTLPALSAAIGFLFGLALFTLVLLVPLYFVRGDLAVGPRRLIVEPSAGMHLGILLAVLLLLTALRLWMVAVPDLLYSDTGPLVGGSYTDLHARLPALRITAALALLAAVAVLVGAARGRLAGYALWAVGGYLSSAAIARWLFPLAMQSLIVAPTELTRESPYLRNHIVA
ncbi:MAG TPA: UPF0182 family protein, partial [Gemmatimonadales bacterium]|nr:UPF0182 family protein [Gemmatimonadales bacterium]